MFTPYLLQKHICDTLKKTFSFSPRLKSLKFKLFSLNFKNKTLKFKEFSLNFKFYL